MVIRHEVMENLLITILVLGSTMVGLLGVGAAWSYENDIYSLWNRVGEFEDTFLLRSFLLKRDWINENVTIDELDYILVLTEQCSSEFFPEVPTSLVLAIISVESGFKSDLVGFSNDTGLMQVIPNYHYDRILNYIYDENVDLFDPRLNVMVGMDYLSELIKWSKGDLGLAVMAYNMGQIRARSYHNSGRITSYAKKVLDRMDEIQDILEGRKMTCLY